MMKTTITKKVRPTKKGSAMHPRLKLFLRRSTNVRTPRNKMEVAMKASMGDTNHDKITGTMPCIATYISNNTAGTSCRALQQMSWL